VSRPLLLVLSIYVLLLIAGCQTSPQAAASASPAARPTSIAYTPAQIVPPGTWTSPRPGTPSAREGASGLGAAPTLLRRVEGKAETLLASGVPSGLLENPSNPIFERVGQGERDLHTAGPWKTILTASSSYVLAGNLQGGGDGPDLLTGGLKVAFQKPLDNYGEIGATLSYVHSQYDWSGTNAIFAAPGAPFESVHTLGVGVNLFQPVSESWAIQGAAGAFLSAEQGAALTDGFSWNVSFGVGHRFSPQLDAGVGVLLSETFGDGLFFIGGPQFTWKPRPDWQLSLQGTQLDLIYTPSAVWEIGIGGAFQGVRFRLRDDGPGAGGIVSDTRVPAYVRARYRGLDALDVDLRVGMDLWRYFTIENRQGVAERSFDVDGGAFIDLRAILRL